MGLMSGTSLDGVDVSIIESDGKSDYSSILDRYYEYDDKLIQKIHEIRDKISNSKDLNKYQQEIKDLERDITLFNYKAVNETIKIANSEINVIGFHGQTIFHNPKEKISKQLGDGKLLSQLSKKKVVYDFRKNDLDNGGQGAPLASIFHNAMANKISKKFDLRFPINILNIGGIANVTITADEKKLWKKDKIYSYDIGPGNCLIDEWMRKNSKKKYDVKGSTSKNGKIDELILNQALENFSQNQNYEKSLDVKNFDIFFAKGLSLENGAATITNFTAKLLSDAIRYFNEKNKTGTNRWLVCGGGRKNLYLLESIKKNFLELHLDPIEKYEIDGDFVESQAFAFLAIRTLEGMPISFPSTTRCKEFLTGGVLVENY
jgi:anhydro-N-acetylmuramic acid kinase